MGNTAAKAVLYQYLTEVSEPSQQQNRINVRLNFDPKIKTVNVQVQSPRENAVFRNIRLPRSLQNVLPLIAGQNPVETTFKAVYGKPYYAKCTIGQGYVQTFDKKSYSYNVDECDHMITSDCSKDLSHAVLAKEVNGMKVELQKGEKITLQSSQEQVTVYWSNDNTVVINTPNTRLVHSGKTVTVEEKSSPDGSHCGLCGDYNLDKKAD